MRRKGGVKRRATRVAEHILRGARAADPRPPAAAGHGFLNRGMSHPHRCPRYAASMLAASLLVAISVAIKAEPARLVLGERGRIALEIAVPGAPPEAQLEVW